MRTTIIEVGRMLLVLSARGVEKQRLKLPGVKKAEINYTAGSATVTYEETVLDLKAIKTSVHEYGYHYAGEQLLMHVKMRRPLLTATTRAAGPMW